MPGSTPNSDPRRNIRFLLAARTLLVQAQGLVDLRLYPAIVDRVLRRRRTVSEILLDLTGVTQITDSGRAAFIALDRFVREEHIDATVVNADATIARSVARLCASMRWVG